jgi:hypothetical protein
MDNSDAPLGSPPRSTAFIFIGYLAQTLERNGHITPQDWSLALGAADDFQRETENRVTNDQPY